MSWKDLLKEDKGLGDTIERVTTKTGIDCGCSARKNKLNKLIKYGDE